MEKALPQFFKGMWKTYSDEARKIKNVSKSKQDISQAAFDILARNMSLSVELYEFLRQRLQMQAKLFNIESFGIEE